MTTETGDLGSTENKSVEVNLSFKDKNIPIDAFPIRFLYPIEWTGALDLDLLLPLLALD